MARLTCTVTNRPEEKTDFATISELINFLEHDFGDVPEIHTIARALKDRPISDDAIIHVDFNLHNKSMTLEITH